MDTFAVPSAEPVHVTWVVDKVDINVNNGSNVIVSLITHPLLSDITTLYEPTVKEVTKLVELVFVDQV